MSDEIRVPDLAEPILGYRSWQPSVVEGQLRSLTQPSEWTPGTPFAASTTRCPNIMWHRRGDFELRNICPPGAYVGGGSARMITTACGIYAHRLAYQIGSAHRWPRPIHGEVLLWGRCYEYTQGWRASFARPAAFYLLPDDQEYNHHVRRLADTFEVPVKDAPNVHNDTNYIGYAYTSTNPTSTYNISNTTASYQHQDLPTWTPKAALTLEQMVAKLQRTRLEQMGRIVELEELCRKHGIDPDTRNDPASGVDG